jgi:spermidine synthase
MQGTIKQGNPLVFEEIGPDHTRTLYELRKIIYRGNSRFQSIDIVETFDYGRMLILDGCAMVSERDEANYHEMIAHVPILLHPNPKRLLVIGGGDGGTVREVAKHPQVEQIDLVEIDKQVVDACKLYLPSVAGKLNDPRVSIHYRDGKEFVTNLSPKLYDIILIDSSDPIGPAAGLFTTDFYRACASALTDNGILVAQSESPYIYPDVLRQIFRLFTSLFPYVSPYKVSVPTYSSGQLYFMLGSKQSDVQSHIVSDRTDRFFKEHGESLRYLTPGLFRSVFTSTAEIAYLWR